MPPRGQIPPLRHCRDCGADTRSWTEAPLCSGPGSNRCAEKTRERIEAEGPLNVRAILAERRERDAEREQRRARGEAIPY